MMLWSRPVPPDGTNLALNRTRSDRPVALACVLALCPSGALAAGESPICALPVIPPPPADGVRAATIEADSARLREDGVSIAEGNVVLRTPDRTITAHRMDYDAGAGLAEALGGVTVRERKLYLEGNRLRANLESGETVLTDAKFLHPDSHGRGTAQRIENTPSTTVLTAGTFTTCEPGSNPWQLEASSLELDRDSGIGTARNARLDVFGVPVLYTPWLSFPLGDERKTGLLTPSIGTSDNAGASLTQPLYLNLAPNFDATLRARFTSRRGEVLGGRFRYLTKRSAGFLDAEALPEDRITGESRSLVSFRHRHAFAPGLDATVQYAHASDIDYLRDVGTGSAAVESDHLRRFAEASYELPGLMLETRIEDFQSLREPDITRDPYRLAPGLAVETRLPERNRRLNFELRGELARFEHRSDALASGKRVHLRPSATLPIRSSSGYLVPRATFQYTGYDLDEVRANVEESPARPVPSFSLDGGLYFAHDSALGGRRLTRTIEPRFHYLWVEYRDQDHLPLFDAGSFTFGYDSMFRENRFSGIDRIGDENRLTLAIESRIFDGERELVAARFGRMQHLEGRRVRLCTTADPGTDAYACPRQGAVGERWGSGWAADLKVRPHRSFMIGVAFADDGHRARHRRLSLDLRYQPSPERVVNLGFRRVPLESESVGRVQDSVEGTTELVSFSFHRDFGRNLRILGSASYALEEDTMTEVFAGLSYDSCCWSARVLGRRQLTPEREEIGRVRSPGHENSIFLQFELKGLSGSGSDYRQWWSRPIAGYRNRY